MTPLEQISSNKVQKALLGFCIKITGSRDSGMELCQDVLLKALRNLDGYDDKGKISAWLATIARRRAIDLHRRKRAFVEVEERHVGYYEHRGFEFEAEYIWEAIEEMGEKERVLLEMVMDGVSYKETK